MTDEDRRRWDERYAGRGPAPVDTPGPPAIFAPYADVFPTAGHGLDLACGQGLGTIWLANREHEVLMLHTRLVNSYTAGNWCQDAKIPEHPHCTHVIRPIP